MRVLICTNDVTFNVSLAASYRARGHEVHVSEAEFFLRQDRFDLIHFHWPEELTAWRSPPSPMHVTQVSESLAWWRERSRLICTVHNLLPHAMPQHDDRTPAYYAAFYGAMHRIGHFSQTSRDAVLAQFPMLAEQEHVVHGMNLFENLRALSTGREAARAALGVNENDLLLLTLGSLRSWSELHLLMAALDRCTVRNKSIHFYARGGFSGNRLKREAQRWRFDRWARRRNVHRKPDLLADRELVTSLEAADALLVSRPPGQLNSGLLPLAMTFGTPMVVPDYGVFREMLQGSGNGLYAPGDAASMAQAIASVASQDGRILTQNNTAIARDWGWSRALDKLLSGYE